MTYLRSYSFLGNVLGLLTDYRRHSLLTWVPSKIKLKHLGSQLIPP